MVRYRSSRRPASASVVTNAWHVSPASLSSLGVDKVMPDNSETVDGLETSLPSPTEPVKNRPVLLAFVIVTGVLLVVGFIAVFGTIVYRVVNSAEPVDAAVRGQFGSVDVSVADGTSLLGTTFIEDRLSIVTNSEGITEVIIIDTKRGVELGRVRLVPNSMSTAETKLLTDGVVSP